MTSPSIFVLDSAEAESIARLVHAVRSEEHGDLFPEQFAERAHLYSDELPRRLRSAFSDFRYQETVPALLVKNSPGFSSLEFPTPSAIPLDGNATPITDDEILHILYACRLGDIFAWDSTQNGNIINHVVPLQSKEDLPTGSGSKVPLDLHSEDAFHDCAGEYFSLYCLRNDEAAHTLIAFIDDVQLSAADKKLLFCSDFLIKPSIVHAGMLSGRLRPILYGDPAHPYIRANFNSQFDEPAEEWPAFGSLIRLREGLMRVVQRITLERSDAIFVDNTRTLHGRERYTPDYTGHGRWLKRIAITSNLKHSRGLRINAQSRAVSTAGGYFSQSTE